MFRAFKRSLNLETNIIDINAIKVVTKKKTKCVVFYVYSIHDMSIRDYKNISESIICETVEWTPVLL